MVVGVVIIFLERELRKEPFTGGRCRRSSLFGNYIEHRSHMMWLLPYYASLHYFRKGTAKCGQASLLVIACRFCQCAILFYNILYGRGALVRVVKASASVGHR